MAHSQQILSKKILKFEDLETRFKHVEKNIAREKFLTSPLVDGHHVTYLTKLNSTKLFWATTRSMQNTIKADQVTHMKTKPKFLFALKFQDMKDLTSEPHLEDNPLEPLSIKKLIL